MNKNLFGILIFTFISYSLFSQEREKGTFEITPKIGYISSFLNGDNVDEFESRGAIRFAVNVDYYFNDRWSLRSGINYDSMGFKIFGNETPLDYINIPVNANWHFGSTRKWNLNFGITPGFLIKAEEEGVDLLNQNEDIVETFQLAVSYGIGYRLEITEKFGLLFDFQGIVGVTNVNAVNDLTRLNAGSSFNIGGVFALD